MRTVFDSSSFAKRYIAEPGSAAVDEICQETTELGICVLCVAEIVSALNRRVREGVLPASGYQEAKAHLLVDVSDAEILQLTPEVMAVAIRLLESSGLRALDALHVACALTWRADLFVTSDQRQFMAAQLAGLDVRLV